MAMRLIECYVSEIDADSTSPRWANTQNFIGSDPITRANASSPSGTAEFPIVGRGFGAYIPESIPDSEDASPITIEWKAWKNTATRIDVPAFLTVDGYPYQYEAGYLENNLQEQTIVWESWDSFTVGDIRNMSINIVPQPLQTGLYVCYAFYCKISFWADVPEPAGLNMSIGAAPVTGAAIGNLPIIGQKRG